MICTLTIVRYPKYLGFVGILSMAIFHFPLFLNKKISFYKLMGCGKNGTFDKTPDWRQWATLTVDSAALTEDSWATAFNSHPTTVTFLKKWFKFFHAEVLTIVLQPIEGHGTWDGKTVFGNLPKQTDYEGLIAVLTRATIRLNKLKNFWENVDAVASQMIGAKGFVTSFGIGEVPFIKQATFSIWDSKADMKNFAYNLHQ
ncbi:MAG: spheroidene monooxygenase, partial [Pedobacter sp.]|nr:spheroidene monooxygenase [Chitinophagaceae bacterium]